MPKDRLIEEKLHSNPSVSPIGFFTAQKMLKKLLTRDRIKTSLENEVLDQGVAFGKAETRVKPFTQEELASVLKISTKELQQLIRSSSFYVKHARNISPILVRLYCAVKFL